MFATFLTCSSLLKFLPCSLNYRAVFLHDRSLYLEIYRRYFETAVLFDSIADVDKALVLGQSADQVVESSLARTSQSTTRFNFAVHSLSRKNHRFSEVSDSPKVLVQDVPDCSVFK